MSTDKHYIVAANKSFYLVKYPRFTHFDNVTKQEYGYWTFNEKKRLTNIPFRKYVESNDYANYADHYPTFWSAYALDYNLKDEIVWKRETDAYDCRCVSNKFNSRKGSCLFNSLHSFFCHDGIVAYRERGFRHYCITVQQTVYHNHRRPLRYQFQYVILFLHSKTHSRIF